MLDLLPSVRVQCWRHYCNICHSGCDSCPGVYCAPGQYGAAEHVTRGHARGPLAVTEPKTPFPALSCTIFSPSPAHSWCRRSVDVQQRRGSYTWVLFLFPAAAVALAATTAAVALAATDAAADAATDAATDAAAAAAAAAAVAVAAAAAFALAAVAAALAQDSLRDAD